MCISLWFAVCQLVIMGVSGTDVSEATIQYIQKCISIYEADPVGYTFDGIVNSPRNIIEDHEQIEHFFFPKLIIWCPLTRYNIDILCPSHKVNLKPSFWTDSNKKWRQPRLLYDLNGNIFLVARYYVCQSSTSCRVRSTDEIVISQLPRWIYVPFVLSHRSGISNELMDFIYCQVGSGTTFNEMSKAIKVQNWSEYHRRLKIFLLKHEIKENEYKELENEDCCKNLFAPPSSDLLIHCFLKDFNKMQHLFSNEMEELSASAISIDHTFKISKNVGVRDSVDRRSKQYPYAFIVMNEIGQIISWALTKTTGFEEVRTIFSNLRERFIRQGVSLRYVHIDNCCNWRAKILSEFSPATEVKLDLFHAVKRFTSTIPKRGSNNCERFGIIQDFSLVFRQSDDQGTVRHKPTPDVKTIQDNMDNFLNKWSSSSLYGDEADNAINNIKKHIAAKCVSNILPGHGTERNENLHSILNSSVLSHARTVGPELTLAVLTVLFFAFNKRIIGKEHQGRNYLLLQKLFNNSQTTETFGLIGSDQGQSSHCEHNAQGVECLAQDDNLNDIERHAFKLYEVLKQLSGKCLSRSIDIQNLPLRYNKYNLCFLNGNTNAEINSSEIDKLLERRLLCFDLYRVEMPKNGNCAFLSIAQQLQHINENSDQLEFLIYLQELNLVGTIENTSNVLRKLFVQELKTNAEEYVTNYTQGLDLESFHIEADKFLEDGIFSGQIGDLIMLVPSKILCCSIIIITSLETLEVIPVFPNEIKCNCSMFVAYDHTGAGHYDGTLPKDTSPCQIEGTNKDSSTDKLSSQGCRCGWNLEKQTDTFVACNDDKSSKYKSRCKCLKARVGCISCSCKNCGNVYNDIPSLCAEHKLKNCLKCRNRILLPTKRKRRKQDTDYNRKSGITFLRQMDESVSERGWTCLETCVVESIVSHLRDNMTEITADSVFNLFTKVANHAQNTKYLRVKTKEQIVSKLKHRSEHQGEYKKQTATQFSILKDFDQE